MYEMDTRAVNTTTQL